MDERDRSQGFAFVLPDGVSYSKGKDPRLTAVDDIRESLGKIEELTKKISKTLDKLTVKAKE